MFFSTAFAVAGFLGGGFKVGQHSSFLKPCAALVRMGEYRKIDCELVVVMRPNRWMTKKRPAAHTRCTAGGKFQTGLKFP